MDEALLRRKLSETLAPIHDPVGKLYHASGMIIQELLGDEFANRCIWPADEPDPFFLNMIAGAPNINFARTVLFASNLFTLRNTPGFDVLAERCRTRDTRAPYFEAQCAAQVQKAGYEVTIREEVGRRREDFDFHATLHGQTLNCEVTACTKPDFSRGYLMNVLQNKRRQLPNDAPAGIFCVHPHSWVNGIDGLWFDLLLVSFQFFAKSRRINFISYVSEIEIKQDKSWVAAGFAYDVFNTNARFNPPDLSFMSHSPEGMEQQFKTFQKEQPQNPTLEELCRYESFRDLLLETVRER